MRIEVKRFRLSEKETVGLLVIDGEVRGFTLEDPVREEKIPNETAIPEGEYRIDLRYEGGMITRYRQKFGEQHEGMLWLQSVPGFEYVYIHIGNTVKDTSGCILIANMYDIRNPGVIGVSTSLYEQVYYEILDNITSGQPVTCKVTTIAEKSCET